MRYTAQCQSDRPTILPEPDPTVFPPKRASEQASGTSSTSSDSGVHRAPRDSYTRIKSLVAAGEYVEAMDVAEDLRRRHPGEIEAEYYFQDCRLALIDRHEKALGSLQQVPLRVVPMSELRALPLDPKTVFVLDQIDGMSTVDDIIDACGLPRVDALRVLVRLVEDEMIELT